MKNAFLSFMRLSILLAFTFALMCTLASPQVPNPLPSHWKWSGVTPAPVPVSASAIGTLFGDPITDANLCFAPVDANGKPVGFRVGQVQVMTTPKCGLVSNGLLQAGLSVAPTPAGVWYHPYVVDRKTGSVLRDYCVTQITGSSWSLDSYDCATASAPPPAAGSITGAPTAELAVYCGSNPTSTLCGIPYQGLYDTGSILTTSFSSSGAPTATCDAAHLFTKDYDLTNLGQEYTCLFASGSYAWQQTAGAGGGTPGPQGPAGPQGPPGPQGPAGTGTGGGVSAPYPVVVSSGDSSSMYSSTAPHITTTGPTSCDGTYCTVTSTNPYVAGQWITFDNNGLGAWGCLGFSVAQVLPLGLSSSSFKVLESQTLLPTYAGCTGVQGPFLAGGLIQDSDILYAQTAVKLPALSGNGSAVPTLYPYGIPGNTIVADDAQFAARYGATAPSSPHGALLINNEGENDMNGCESVSVMEAAYQSFWTKAHAANYDVLQITPINSWTLINGGITCNENYALQYDTIMQWLLTQKCTSDNGTTGCWDYMADAGDILKDGNNLKWDNNHPTPAAYAVTASIINQAIANGSQVNYAYAPGSGPNIFHGPQYAPSFNVGGHGMSTTYPYTLGASPGTDSIIGLGKWGPGGTTYFTIFDGVPLCFQKGASDCSTQITYGIHDNAFSLGSAGSGGLELTYEYFTSLASDPTSPGEGQCWFNSTNAKFRCRQGGSNVGLGDAVALPNPAYGPQTFQADATNHVAVTFQGSTTVNVSAVQTVDNSVTGTGSIPFTSPVTAGNAIIASCSNNTSVAPTDTLGNTFVLIQADTAGTTSTSIWIAKNILGGTDTVDCKGGYPHSTATELFGVDGAAPVESSSFIYHAFYASNVITATPITMTAPGAVISVFASGCGGQMTFAPTPGYTVLHSIGGQPLTVAIAPAASPGTYGATWNTTAFNGCHQVAYMVGLKGNPTSVQTADLIQNKLSNGTLVSGVNGAALPYTVPVMFSALPTCSTAAGLAGSEATVKDSSVSTWGSTVTGTGTAVTPYTHIWCDGAHWVVR